ncbi:hypothetical protein GCM10028805_52390 [Spirosoma harenae]
MAIDYAQSGYYNTTYRVLLERYMQSPTYDIDNLARAEQQGNKVEVTRLLGIIRENLLNYLDDYESIKQSGDNHASLRSRAMQMASYAEACQLVKDIDDLERLEELLG